jgi:hypothetical protein
MYLIMILFLSLTEGLFSQDAIINEAKNTISLNCADIIVTGNYSLNYERCIYKGQKIRCLINIGYGGWYSFYNYQTNWNSIILYSNSIPIAINCLTGIGNNHFEFDIGAQLLPDKTWGLFFADGDQVGPKPDYNKSKVNPIFNLGYRYQRIQRGIIFRSFIGFGGIGIGFGYAF